MLGFRWVFASLARWQGRELGIRNLERGEIVSEYVKLEIRSVPVASFRGGPWAGLVVVYFNLVHKMSIAILDSKNLKS